MPVLDNSKWELVAQEVAKGKTQLEAIGAAGYAPHDSNASRLIGNDKGNCEFVSYRNKLQ
jgi:hypothetical protein